MIWLKLGLVLAIVAAALWFKHTYDQGIRNQEIAACNSRNQEAKAKLVLDYVAKDAQADAAAKERDDALRDRDAARAALAAKVAHADVILPADLGRVLNGTPGQPAGSGNGTPAASTDSTTTTVPATQVYDSQAIAAWWEDVQHAYESCTADDADVRQRYEGAREAQLRGSP